MVAQPEAIQTDVLSKEDEDDIPDIEYMPPKPVELADPPEEIIYDDTFPQFQGRNMFRGWQELYGPPVGPDGLTDSQRELEARLARETEEAQRKLDAQINDDSSYHIDPEAEADREVERLIQSHFAGKKSQVETTKAKAAAFALHAPVAGRLTKPTLASQQRSKVPPVKTKKPTPQPTNPSPMRHAALAATSKTTVGYSKGRNVSNKLSSHITNPNNKPSSVKGQDDMSPIQFRTLFGEPPVGSRMWYRLHEQDFPKPDYGLDDLGDDFEALSTRDVLLEIDEDEDGEVFQL